MYVCGHLVRQDFMLVLRRTYRKWIAFMWIVRTVVPSKGLQLTLHVRLPHSTSVLVLHIIIP